MTASVTRSNLEIAGDVVDGVFNDRAVERFERRLAEPYVDHDTFLGHDLPGLRAFITAAPSRLSWEPIEHDAQGELVMLHGTLRGMSPAVERFAAVYVFRFVDGLIVEHWDALAEVVEV